MAEDSGSIYKEKEKDLKDLFAKGSDFLDMYSKVAEFTKELVQENSRLQDKVNELIKDREKYILDAPRNADEKELINRIEKLKREKKDILNQYRQVEEENKDFQQRYYTIETENDNLANLYVASYQLHSTLDLAEVLEIITEIIINLIGSEAFSIMLVNEKNNVIEPVKSEGMPRDALPRVRVGEGIIGGAVESGETYYREAYSREEQIDPHHPLVAVPLQINEEVIGAIVVYQLLAQKESLSKVDYDLFNLLAAHAATAVFSAKLYGDSVRKQATIKGFLDLITH